MISAAVPIFPPEAATRDYAASLDATDPLRGFRDEFIIPSKANLATKKVAKPGQTPSSQGIPDELALNMCRPFFRAEHILLRELARPSASGRVKVYGSSVGYLVLHWCLWAFYGSRGFTSTAMATIVGEGGGVNVEDRRRTARRGCCHGNFDHEFAFTACELL